MSRILLSAILISFSSTLCAQGTLGVVHYEPSSVQEGYNLYFPHNQGTAWLLDNCGQIVHRWENPSSRPGNSVYLLDNGDLLQCAKDTIHTNLVINAGGAGQYVQRLDWDNNVLWRYEISDNSARMHHDIAPMPNGNVLAVVWELKDSLECIQAGRNPAFLSAGGALWPDMILELQPIGTDSAAVVWEWHAWDHLIQDFDPNMDNYGVVADHPELMNINYVENGIGADWMHVNAIDYNADLDQIMISVPFMNEIWIIDHSTSTAEAASHNGGNSGMGGDIIYRWGNPFAYGVGLLEDAQLVFQHDCHWIKEGTGPSDPDLGKILVFNNRIGGDYSTVDLIDPPVNGFNYDLVPGSAYGPLAPDWTYVADPPQDMFSGGLSGAQKLANGNYLIASGRQGQAIEIDPSNSNELVWEFVNPLIQGQAGTNGTIPGPGQNVFFRMNRIYPDSPALDGRDLTPQGYIELEPDTAYCDSLSVGIFGSDQESSMAVPNPFHSYLTVDVSQDGPINLYNLQGQLVFSEFHRRGKVILSTIELPAGTYFLQHSVNKVVQVMKM